MAGHVRAPRPERRTGSDRPGPSPSADRGITRLQRTVGNAALTALLEGRVRAPAGVLPVVQRQGLPSARAINAEIRDHHGESSSAYETLSTLFHRLHSARRLRDPNGALFRDVASAVNLVFPPPRKGVGPRVFVADTYTAIVDRSKGREDAPQAVTGAQPIKDEHWRELAPVLDGAVKLALRCCTATEALGAVFGLGADQAAGTFKTISARLGKFGQQNFTVNYSSSDDITGADGASVAGSGLIELSGSLVTSIASKKDRALAVLIHEAAHETDARIVDLGYSGTAGFEYMLESDKLGNADHYADVAERLLGTSRYANVVFTAKSGVLAGVERVDHFRKAVKAASDGLEKLWSLSRNLDDIITRLAPGVDAASGRPTGSADSEGLLGEKRDMAAAIKTAYRLPAAKRPFRMTEVDHKLVQTTAMVFVRALKRLNRIAEKPDPAIIDKLIGYDNAFDLASAAIWQVGGLLPDRDESNALHYAIAAFAHERFKVNAYPS